jgi:SAM-dependent methyltransferase
MEAVGVAPGLKLLDVATGPGYGAGAAAERGAITVGVDFSPAMVRVAQRRHPGLVFAEGDAERLSFPDHSFDAVIMNFGLLHLARPEAALAEAYRVLRHGGRYAFTVWGTAEQAVAFGIVLKAIETCGTIDVGLPDGPPFFRFSDPRECRRSLEEAGFAQQEVRQLPLVWRLSSTDALFEAVSRGGVRTAALLRGQTPDALSAIRRAVARALVQYGQEGAVDVPMTAVLASAVKT